MALDYVALLRKRRQPRRSVQVLYGEELYIITTLRVVGAHGVG